MAVVTSAASFVKDFSRKGEKRCAFTKYEQPCYGFRKFMFLASPTFPKGTMPGRKTGKSNKNCLRPTNHYPKPEIDEFVVSAFFSEKVLLHHIF
jgi:hypothetical protein